MQNSFAKLHLLYIYIYILFWRGGIGGEEKTSKPNFTIFSRISFTFYGKMGVILLTSFINFFFCSNILPVVVVVVQKKVKVSLFYRSGKSELWKKSDEEKIRGSQGLWKKKFFRSWKKPFFSMGNNILLRNWNFMCNSTWQEYLKGDKKYRHGNIIIYLESTHGFSWFNVILFFSFKSFL